MLRLMACLRELVIANRILGREGVVDAFGHVSVRHPDNPERFLLSQSRSPELVSIDDIMEFTLDGVPVEPQGRTPYAERVIHGGIYESRPEVNGIVHNHSPEVIPFGITDTKLRPVGHTCAPIGNEIPVWDIRTKFGNATDMLLVNMDQSRDLARSLGSRRVALMRGHGSVTAGATVKEAVMIAVYLQVNARIQLEAIRLGNVNYLTPEEVESCTRRQLSPLAIDRAWDYWKARAGCAGM